MKIEFEEEFEDEDDAGSKQGRFMESIPREAIERDFEELREFREM